jgi:hypothetical protein
MPFGKTRSLVSCDVRTYVPLPSSARDRRGRGSSISRQRTPLPPPNSCSRAAHRARQVSPVGRRRSAVPDRLRCRRHRRWSRARSRGRRCVVRASARRAVEAWRKGSRRTHRPRGLPALFFRHRAGRVHSMTPETSESGQSCRPVEDIDHGGQSRRALRHTTAARSSVGRCNCLYLHPKKVAVPLNEEGGGQSEHRRSAQ